MRANSFKDLITALLSSLKQAHALATLQQLGPVRRVCLPSPSNEVSQGPRLLSWSADGLQMLNSDVSFWKYTFKKICIG